MRKTIIIIIFTIIAFREIYSQSSVYRSAPIGTYGGIMNPDLSVVVDIQGLFTDRETAEKNKVLLKSAEVVFGSYLYPGIRGDVVCVFEQEYSTSTADVTSKFHLEEAYISFLELPLGLQLIIGRKLIDFGKLNQYHPHHWHFADPPLIHENIFGGHPWSDDLINLSFLIPNPLDIYFKESVSVINGKPLKYHHHHHHHHHHHEEHNHGEHSHEIHWKGRVFNSRTSVDLPWINSLVGYSLAFDEKSHSIIEGVELTYKYQWPGFTYRRLKLQNEYIWGKSGDKKISPGLYSMLAFSFNQYTELGLRYDVIFDANHIKEWAGNAFATYYFTHSFYLRGQYQYKSTEEKKENKIYLQLVWGVGPHAHRLED